MIKIGLRKKNFNKENDKLKYKINV